MRAIFGGTIAVILLGLYSFSIAVAVGLAFHPTVSGLGKGYEYTISMVGGLVSALVIAELAITPPGKPPLSQFLMGVGDTPPSPQAAQILLWLTGAYVLVWMLLGLIALVVGVLQKPGIVQPLTDCGQAWLGLAVAAGYAYFGLTPRKG